MAETTMHPNAVMVSETEITCTLCKEHFILPKLVDCLHTYCHKCILEKAINTDTGLVFTCLQCLHITQIKDSSAESLVSSHHVGRLQDINRCRTTEVSRCFVCSLKSSISSATHRCLDCDDRLCENCSKGHNLSSLTASHRVVCLDDLRKGQYDQEILVKRTIFCKDHSDELCQLFCQTCCEPKCNRCILVKHKDHNYEDIQEAARRCRLVLGDQLKESASGITYNRAVTAAQADLDILDKEEELFVQKVAENTSLLMAKIKREGESVLQKGREGFAEERKIRHGKIESAIREYAKRENIIGTCHKVAKDEGLEIVLLSDALQKGLRSLEEFKSDGKSTITLTTFRTTLALSQEVDFVLLHRLDFTRLNENNDGSETIWTTLKTSENNENLNVYHSADSNSATNKDAVETKSVKETTDPKIISRTDEIHTEAAANNNQPKPSTSIDVTLQNLTLKRMFSIKIGTDKSEPDISFMTSRTPDTCLILDTANGKLKCYRNSGDFEILVELQGKCSLFKQFVHLSARQMVAAVYENLLLVMTKHLQLESKHVLVSKDAMKDNLIVSNFSSNIIIGNLPNNEMRVLDTLGKTLRKWKRKAQGKIESMKFAGDDKVIISTWQGTGSVSIESEKQGIILQIPGQEREGINWRPVDAVVDPKGNILVTDSHRNEISVFNKTGHFAFLLDVTEHTLCHPKCLFVGKKNNLYVSCKEGRVAVYQMQYK